MKNENIENQFIDISNQMRLQSKRLLKLLSEDLKGRACEIIYDAYENSSCLIEFLNSNNLMINMTYTEFSDEGGTISITFYKLFPSNNYEITIYITSDMEIRKDFPLVILNGLKESYNEQTKVKITL